MEIHFLNYCSSGDIYNIKHMSLKDCDLNEGFRRACYNGHYMIVKYLVELYKNTNYNMIDIHSRDESGFIWACRNGHYNIVKYLVELYKNDENYDKIDIHAFDEEGFNYACMNGHYNIIKYIIELYKNDKNYDMIDINSHNEEGFRWACRSWYFKVVKYFKVIKYLMALHRKHKYKPFNYYLIIFKKFEKYNY